MEPKIASKMSRNLIKNELETKSTKNAENVLNLIPLDLQETRFRMERLSKITKTRGADKSKKIQKIVSKWSQHPWKIGLRIQQKTKLKNRASKIEKYSKHDSKMAPKKWPDFGGNAYGGAFGGPNRFCDEKVGPQRSQSAPKNKKWTKITRKFAKHEPKMAPKRTPSEKMSAKSRPFSEPSKNELQKWTLFGTRPGGLREALTIVFEF